MDIRDAQARMDAIARDKGFNQADIPRQFCYMAGEVAEAFDAWNKGEGQEALGHELADVFNNVCRVASMTGVDLATAVQEKQEILAHRVYQRGRGPGLVKAEEREAV